MPTKIVPEELAPVQPIGMLTLNRNPTNYFAETEQVAFHTANLVPGIEVTNDPLMQARLFSYLDTQLTRLGGPNFTQLPINCPHAGVNDMLRDGMHQMAIHDGIAPYRPNSLDDGVPEVAGESEGGYVQTARPVSGPVVRESPTSFADHFSQARMFWLSMTADRAIAHRRGLHLRARQGSREGDQGAHPRRAGQHRCRPVCPGGGRARPAGSERLTGIGCRTVAGSVADRHGPGPIAGRVVGVIAGDGADLPSVTKLRRALAAEGAVLRIVAATGGSVGKGRGKQVVDRTFATTRSVEFDAVLVADGMGGLRDVKVTVLLQEMFRHCKALGAWGTGAQVLTDAGVDIGAPGVLIAEAVDRTMTRDLIAAMGLHRAWDRAPLVMKS